MAVKFHSSGDAILSYCIVFSMYVTLWSIERQSDALLLVLYYSDFFYIAQYVCVKLNKAWQELNSEISRLVGGRQIQLKIQWCMYRTEILIGRLLTEWGVGFSPLNF